MNLKNYIPKDQRKKILFISDDLRFHSGIANITKEIIMHTSQHFNWVQMGGAINHPDKGKRFDLSEETNKIVNITDSSVFLYPVDGYGDVNILRQIINLEKPDALFLMGDPRYMTWLFQIENEIRKQMPISWLNIWDSPFPYPLWNKAFYESTDLLMGISKQTVNINKVVLGDKGEGKLFKHIPHGMDSKVFKPLPESDPQLIQFKKQLFGNKVYDFALFFNSRNIRRKQIPDTLLAFRMFLDMLSKEEAEKCCFVLHTQVVDDNGTDLGAVTDYLFDKYPGSILFSPSSLPPEQMNLLYNSTDCQILLTDNEGFGISLLEAILSGNPIIANQQGGPIDMMRFEDEFGQWIDFNKDFPSNHRNTYPKHGEWAFPVVPSNISIQGSPQTPYISSDRVRPEDAADEIFEVYSLGKEERKRRGAKGREWALSDEAGMTSEHQAERVISAMDELFETWKPRSNFELINCTEHKIVKSIDHPLIY